MQLVSVSSQRRDEWNAFVAASPGGHILQSWEWGDIKASTGWQAHRLALQDGDTIRAAAQVLVRNLPFGLGRLAYVPRGPALDYGDASLLREVLTALRNLAADLRVISLKIEPELTEPSELARSLSAQGVSASTPVQMRSTIWVDIAPAEEEILARQKQKTRYNTRLAARKGVTVSTGAVEDIDAWYRVYELTSRRDQFTIHDLDYYCLVYRTLAPRGMATLLLAHHDGDLLGGIIVFAFGPKAQYMYGASGNEKRNLMAPYLLQWEGMRWARSQGASIYDLWGVPDRLEEKEDLWGVYRHKRGYGGELVRYVGAFDVVRAPLQHLALERVARPLFKRVARMAV